MTRGVFLLPESKMVLFLSFLVALVSGVLALIAFVSTWVLGYAVDLAVLRCSSPLGLWDVRIRKSFFMLFPVFLWVGLLPRFLVCLCMVQRCEWGGPIL